MARLRFWSSALLRGWAAVVSLRDHLEMVAVLFVTIGVLIGVTRVGLNVPLEAHAAGILLLIGGAVVLEGAYREWAAVPRQSALVLRQIPANRETLIRAVSELERNALELLGEYQMNRKYKTTSAGPIQCAHLVQMDNRPANTSGLLRRLGERLQRSGVRTTYS
jgi:hypothetical protein